MNMQIVLLLSSIFSAQTATSIVKRKNVSFTNRTTNFNVQFDAVPSMATQNALVGLSKSAAANFNDLAAIVRFGQGGVIHARNGATYAALAVVKNMAGKSYHARMLINMAARTYSVYIKPESSTEVLLAQNYAFQSSQSTVTSLANRAVYIETGGLVISNFSISAFSATPTPTPVAAEQRLFSSEVPALLHQADGASINYELGMRFTSMVAGQIRAIRFYKDSSESGSHIGRIFGPSGQLAQVTFLNESQSGWQEQRLATPLSISADTEYVVSVNTGNTYYVATLNGLASQASSINLRRVVGNNGVYGNVGVRPTSSYQNSNYFRDVVFAASGEAPAPAPAPTPAPAPGDFVWPTASNTGVPAAVNLTPYTGPETISVNGTVIDGKIINGTLRVTAANVVIKNSVIQNFDYWGIDAERAANITVQDCDFVGPGYSGPSSAAILGSGNILRNDISRMENGIQLTGGSSVVKGNYIHDLESPASDPHYDGIQAQGGQDGVLIEDNYVEGRDTSDVLIQNAFGPVTNVTVNHNYLTGTPGYNVYSDARFSGGPIIGVKITNNILNKGGYGYYSIDNNAPVISGNIDAVTGMSVPY